MWNRVVNMENVEVESGHHLGHLRCQYQIVRRVLEEWIAEDFDFMKVDPIGHRQANREGIADKVNVMSARCKLLPQFGGNDAAAAIRGVTSDPDLHISMT